MRFFEIIIRSRGDDLECHIETQAGYKSPSARAASVDLDKTTSNGHEAKKNEGDLRLRKIAVDW